MGQRKGGLGPRGSRWVAAAAAHHIHDAEVVDDERLAVPAGTPALLSRSEAEDVLEVLEAVAVATPAGPGKVRVEELALALRERLREHQG
ncbi:hypothetical protein [Nocardiopsis metallicus]|uniref:Uncharacterized protein n=1 Tax=Nocardiopsis metallicus TaxID=179819 RepID=A0A840WUU8_9ACTN|nr:hypothetical protein [Nocardiopsis metallicus]MBB5495805.1 hypothetical protein [Nocardiopsis metallicus]